MTVRSGREFLAIPGPTTMPDEVLAAMHRDSGGVPEFVPAVRLGNVTSSRIDLTPAASEPAVASIYQLDGLVRRATSLQLTADGRSAATQAVAQEALA